MADSYLTIEKYTEAIYKEKGSKFLAFAYPVTTQDEIKQILADLRKKYFGPEGEMAQKEEALMAPIQNRIYEAVKQIALQRGYDAIIDRASANSVIFASPKIDISNEILTKLGYSK